MALPKRLALPATILVTTTLLAGCVYVNEAPDCVSTTDDAGAVYVSCRLPTDAGSCIITRTAADAWVSTWCRYPAGSSFQSADGFDSFSSS